MSDCTEITCPHHGWWNQHKAVEQPLVSMLLRALSRARASGVDVTHFKVAGNPRTRVQVRFQRVLELKQIALLAGMPVVLDPEIPAGKFRLRYDLEVDDEGWPDTLPG